MKSIKAPGGGVYRREFYKCNKERCKKCRDGPGHGPYWSRYWWEDGKTRKEYIGKTLPLTKDTGEEGPPLTEDQPLPKTLTKDKTSPRSLPKTSPPPTKDNLTKDKSSLPKTRQKALPKIKEGALKTALELGLEALEAGKEPPISEIADAVGVEGKTLGRHLKALGLEGENLRREGVRARRLTLEMRPKIEELIAKGELEE